MTGSDDGGWERSSETNRASQREEINFMVPETQPANRQFQLVLILMNILEMNRTELNENRAWIEKSVWLSGNMSLMLIIASSEVNVSNRQSMLFHWLPAGDIQTHTHSEPFPFDDVIKRSRKC